MKIQVKFRQDRMRKTEPDKSQYPDSYGPDDYGLYWIPEYKILTYETDRSLKIGDIVRCPRPFTMGYSSDGPVEGEVVALASDYDGPCLKI